MSRLKSGFVVATVVFCCSAQSAQAQSPSSSQALAPDHEVMASAFVSVGYSFNFGQPSSRTNQYRVFDVKDAAIKMDVAEFIIQSTATRPRALGFRADVLTGWSVPRVSAASGLFRDVTTGIVTPQDLDVKQIYVTYVAPVGGGIRLDIGKFSTPVGAEVIEGHDGFGDNYTHGFLFGYAEPFTHTGLRAAYTFTPHLSATVLVVNGWDNVRDNNSAKSIGAQVAITANPRLTMSATYLGGRERSDSSDRRHLVNVVAVAKATSSTTVTSSIDVGYETGAAGDGIAAHWRGVSTSVKQDINARFSLSARGEIFTDAQGVRTRIAQTLSELTLTPWFTLGSHTVLRSDVRVDHSTRPVFEARDTFRRHQISIAFNTVFVF